MLTFLVQRSLFENHYSTIFPASNSLFSIPIYPLPHHTLNSQQGSSSLPRKKKKKQDPAGHISPNLFLFSHNSLLQRKLIISLIFFFFTFVKVCSSRSVSLNVESITHTLLRSYLTTWNSMLN